MVSPLDHTARQERYETSDVLRQTTGKDTFLWQDQRCQGAAAAGERRPRCVMVHDSPLHGPQLEVRQSRATACLGQAGCSWPTCRHTKRRRRLSSARERGTSQAGTNSAVKTTKTHKTRQTTPTHTTKTATFHHPISIGRVFVQPACNPYSKPLDTWSWNEIKRGDVPSSWPHHAQGGSEAGLELLCVLDRSRAAAA